MTVIVLVLYVYLSTIQSMNHGCRLKTHLYLYLLESSGQADLRHWFRRSVCGRVSGVLRWPTSRMLSYVSGGGERKGNNVMAKVKEIHLLLFGEWDKEWMIYWDIETKFILNMQGLRRIRMTDHALVLGKLWNILRIRNLFLISPVSRALSS